MNEAEIKLAIFRLIDQLSGDVLITFYQTLQKQVNTNSSIPIVALPSSTSLEAAYAAMAADTEREQEAFEWIEGSLNIID